VHVFNQNRRILASSRIRVVEWIRSLGYLSAFVRRTPHRELTMAKKKTVAKKKRCSRRSLPETWSKCCHSRLWRTWF